MSYSQILRRAMFSVLGVDRTEYMLYNRHLISDWKLKKYYGEMASDFDLKSFEKMKSEVLNYVSSMRMGKYEYRYSAYVDKPTLYASVYACMIQGLFGLIDENDKEGWKEHFDGFQRDDGLFYDENAYNRNYDKGEGWGAHHLIPHLLIAYERIGCMPEKPFSYLECYFDEDYMLRWLDSLDLSKAWAASNGIMNIGTVMQYVRDRMGLNVGRGLAVLEEWLIRKIRPEYPVWFSGELHSKKNLYEAVRGAYHIYPILLKDEIEIPGFERLISLIPNLQNKWGGFDFPIWSSACTDIDAVDPLIRSSVYTGIRNKDVDHCLKRALRNAMYNQNPDGGFVFSRQNMKHSYGGCENLASKPQQSNMFGTWFRVLCILEILDFFRIKQFDGLGISGYEMSFATEGEN